MNTKSKSESDEKWREFLEKRRREEEARRPMDRLIFWSTLAFVGLLWLSSLDSVRQFFGL